MEARRGGSGVDGSSGGGGGEENREKKEGKVWKEESSVLLKTGGQTVCNWLGPQGLKKRFKESGREGGRGQINR